ncbi:hypothetical protein WIW50_15660 [Flavobacteriaceae bacterium 3-367]|uniref:hypothetical protein n=1 Tax=Eudoraea algarum TaxID=3417568 RepID=UPI003288C162
MELAELQETWSKLNTKIDNQRILTDKVIMDVVKIKYSNKLKSILKYEGTGTAVLFLALIIVIWNIQLFDTLPLQICAVLSIIIMTILPILSLTAVYRMNNMDMAKRNYKQTIIEFTKRRTHFLLVQKWGIVLSAIFMLTAIPLALKIGKGKDFFAGESNNLLWFIPIALIALFFFARWAYGCYVKITADAQNILKELED